MNIDHQGQRISTNWLMHYFNQNKNASYQDKLTKLLLEKNPFYLIEWLLFPMPDEILGDLNFPRSPGMYKNSYIPFSDVFFQQLLYDLVFGDWSVEEHRALLFKTAMVDLELFYKQDVIKDALHHWIEGIKESVKQYRQFQAIVDKDQEALLMKYKEQIQEIDNRLDMEDEEKELKHKAVRDDYLQKKLNIPGQVLQKKFTDSPFVAYIHHKQWPHPEDRVQLFTGHLMDLDGVSYIHYLKQTNFHAVYVELLTDTNKRSHFINWFIAYASKNNFTRGVINVEPRQSWWADLLIYLTRTHDNETQLDVVYGAVFDIQGYEAEMIRGESIPAYLYKLVPLALADVERGRWLREIVILRNWDPFINAFSQPVYDYEALSWILCLDPVSLEQRLLRIVKTNKHEAITPMDPIFIIDRCCTIFADGIKAGINAQVMIPIFHYLAIHNKDILYQYIFRIKSFGELKLLLQMEAPYLHKLFSGESVRAKTARVQIQPLFLGFLHKATGTEEEMDFLKKLGSLLLSNKAQLISSWLDEQAPNRLKWPIREAALLAEILEIDWLGADLKEEGQHAAVEQWLIRHSDWIMFDIDAQQRNKSSVQYRILRPGFQDLASGNVLARILVRAEWMDQEEIGSFLDDLRNL
ncbi:MAG TPA: hypothetical protein VGE40_12820 [Bacilli bacterium]